MSLTDSKRSKNYINKTNENIKVAKVTKFDFKDFNKYKKRVYIGGESIKKVFPNDYPIKKLDLFRKLIKQNK
tara:strand:+ start:222 stop:437 length:216 start_codon:yes stop_codon:yes gene_type:complete